MFGPARGRRADFGLQKPTWRVWSRPVRLVRSPSSPTRRRRPDGPRSGTSPVDHARRAASTTSPSTGKAPCPPCHRPAKPQRRDSTHAAPRQDSGCSIMRLSRSRFVVPGMGRGDLRPLARRVHQQTPPACGRHPVRGCWPRSGFHGLGGQADSLAADKAYRNGRPVPHLPAPPRHSAHHPGKDRRSGRPPAQGLTRRTATRL